MQIDQINLSQQSLRSPKERKVIRQKSTLKSKLPVKRPPATFNKRKLKVGKMVSLLTSNFLRKGMQQMRKVTQREVQKEKKQLVVASTFRRNRLKKYSSLFMLDSSLTNCSITTSSVSRRSSSSLSSSRRRRRKRSFKSGWMPLSSCMRGRRRSRRRSRRRRGRRRGRRFRRKGCTRPFQNSSITFRCTRKCSMP